jgi:hypothetical protein
MLLAAFVLYRDPHGPLVRSLDVASREPTQDLWITDVSGDFPEFYLRHEMKVHFITGMEGERACAEKRPGVLVTSLACTSCTELAKIPAGLGYALRQKISHTPGGRFVYRCGS